MRTIWRGTYKQILSNNEWYTIFTPPKILEHKPCDFIEMEVRANWVIPRTGFGWLVPKFDLAFGANVHKWQIINDYLLKYGVFTVGVGLRHPEQIFMRIRMAGVPSPREFKVRVRGLAEEMPIDKRATLLA